MANIELRVKAGTKSPDDIILTVQDKTYEYLMTSESEEIRISAYLDRDWPMIDEDYEEVFVAEDCPFVSTVKDLIPGSKARGRITLPAPMKSGEQITILVTREPRATE